MKDFRAIVRRERGGEVLLEIPLAATTIQAAIDEAKARIEASLAASDAVERLGAKSLDILADGAIVETVGLGADPYRT